MDLLAGLFFIVIPAAVSFLMINGMNRDLTREWEREEADRAAREVHES